MRRLITLALGITLLLPLISAAEASAELVLCRKGTKLKVRDNKCKAKKDEVEVTAAELGITAGEQGPPGQDGAPGAPGSARAWAAVNPGATPTLFNSLGFDSVRNGSAAVPGVYCLTMTDDTIDPATTAPVASANLTLTNTSAVTLDIIVLVRPSSFVCNDDELEVLTGRVNHDSPDASELDLVGDVGFNVVVP